MENQACTNPKCPAQGDHQHCSLNRLGIGCRGTVVSVAGDSHLRRRLLEMGFCQGVHVQVVRRAPLGDPIELRLRGYSLSLRDEQAQFVTIATAD